VTLGVTQKLIGKGQIQKDSCVVVAITGNGMKTPEYLQKGKKLEIQIRPQVDEFLALIPESNCRSRPDNALR